MFGIHARVFQGRNDGRRSPKHVGEGAISTSRLLQIVMAFMKALAVQHQKHTSERRKIRKKINRMLRRVTAISRKLHTLNSHPGDWIELGISEFARIPDCMTPILDPAGQGVQVFWKTRRVS